MPPPFYIYVFKLIYIQNEEGTPKPGFSFMIVESKF